MAAPSPTCSASADTAPGRRGSPEGDVRPAPGGGLRVQLVENASAWACCPGCSNSGPDRWRLHGACESWLGEGPRGPVVGLFRGCWLAGRAPSPPHSRGNGQ